MRFGRRGERWINLFGAVRPEREPPPNAKPLSANDLDDLVTRVESFLVDEYRKREVTAQTRARSQCRTGFVATSEETARPE